MLFRIICVIILSLCLYFMWGLWQFGARPFVSFDDCPKGHLAPVTSCDGRSHPGFQNSGSYYYIAKGKPLADFCPAFIENYQRLDSPGGRICPTWEKTDCAVYGITGDCFICDRPAVNGNTHYYFLAANSLDCGSGVYFTGSRFKPEDMKEKLK